MATWRVVVLLCTRTIVWSGWSSARPPKGAGRDLGRGSYIGTITTVGKREFTGLFLRALKQHLSLSLSLFERQICITQCNRVL